MIAEAMSPSVKAGMTRCGRSPPPVAGNQPRWSENPRISRSPSQKLGIDTPRRATIIARTSSHEFRTSAATSPSDTPRTSATTMLAVARTAVLPRFSPISWATGRRLRIEVPRSPVQRMADEAAVLDGERVVQVELGAHARDLLGRGGELGQHHLHGVARNEEEEAEDRQRHPHEDGHAGQDARRDVGQHGPSVVRRWRSGGGRAPPLSRRLTEAEPDVGDGPRRASRERGLRRSGASRRPR